jgi:hypothetical protein
MTPFRSVIPPFRFVIPSAARNLLSRLFAVALAFLLFAPLSQSQDTPALPSVQLDAGHAAGRPVEPLTQQSVARDYARAWRTLAEALSENRPAIVDNDFVGWAREKLAAAAQAQAKSGLHRRYVDRGHKVDVLFYSPDGLSIELRDTAQLEFQVLDGDTVIHSESVTRHYVAIMTPTEVRWKVRLLQAVPD